MRKSGIFVVVLLGATILSAHPHFNKTITAQLPGNVEATIAYQTVRPMRTTPTPHRMAHLSPLAHPS